VNAAVVQARLFPENDDRAKDLIVDRRNVQTASAWLPGLPRNCAFCEGSGWRPVFVGGERRVTRCNHQAPRELSAFDRKSAAAGDR
jgi:hypothetical protein